MDLFEKYLHEKFKNPWIARALTDKSYKNLYQRIHHEEYQGTVNTDLATYGDAVIKLCYLELLLDKTMLLTIDKSKVESDEYLVDVVAKHYDLVKFIDFDTNDVNKPIDYNHKRYQNSNGNASKYIATAVEAMIGAIYKSTRDLSEITKLLSTWMSF